MLFNSLEFIFFFCFVFVVHWLLPTKYRWILLLIASYFFYMSWEPAYILLILVSTSVDYFVCNHWTSSANERLRKLGLWTNVGLNLCLLFIFKYFDFFQSTLEIILTQFGISYTPRQLGFLLPVGISFYTFQTLSYAIDVYRRTIPVERHFGKFALFVAFFPQLVAGPIERAKDLIPQLNNPIKKIDYERMKDGILLFFWGLFKKVVVADNVAMFVDKFYATYEYQNGGNLAFATYLFAIQIYCDFSGYSDMAIGLAKMLGYDLMNNFRTPYFSHSFTSFWRNWHISLSTWFRDYVYIPLGGNRSGLTGTIRNNLVTMLIGGLWHGANWTFVIWGGLNGIFLSIEKLLGHLKLGTNKWLYPIKLLVVFHLVCLTWIFFRSQSIEQAFVILTKIVSLNWGDLYFIIADNRYSLAVLSIIILVFIEVQIPFQSITQFRLKNPFYRYSFYTLLILSILLMGASTGAQFIYFQF